MQTEEIKCDVLIAGCGVSGLYAALNLPSTANIIMVTKTVVEECDSMLAQGGICVLHDEGDYDAFYEEARGFSWLDPEVQTEPLHPPAR